VSINKLNEHEIFKETNKNLKVDIDKLLEVDKKRSALQKELETAELSVDKKLELSNKIRDIQPLMVSLAVRQTTGCFLQPYWLLYHRCFISRGQNR
jgi:hypothetical protein